MQKTTLNGNVGIAIVVHGKEVEEYPHKGNTYIWAKKGTEYSIVAWNYTDNNIEAVITVDGLNIINGKEGDYNTQGGYVIPAHTKVKPIPGFLTDGNSAAKFTFGTAESSYANLMGKPNNIGVIGAAFFTEKRKEEIVYTLGLTDSEPISKGGLRHFGNHNPCFGSPIQKGGTIGTQFGKKTEFKTNKVAFRRSSNTPVAIIAIQYRTKEELQRMGVNIYPEKATVANPFPGNSGYCAPPAGYQD